VKVKVRGEGLDGRLSSGWSNYSLLDAHYLEGSEGWWTRTGRTTRRSGAPAALPRTPNPTPRTPNPPPEPEPNPPNPEPNPQPQPHFTRCVRRHRRRRSHIRPARGAWGRRDLGGEPHQPVAASDDPANGLPVSGCRLSGASFMLWDDSKRAGSSSGCCGMVS